jgi:hypothetical protein
MLNRLWTAHVDIESPFRKVKECTCLGAGNCSICIMNQPFFLGEYQARSGDSSPRSSIGSRIFLDSTRSLMLSDTLKRGDLFNSDIELKQLRKRHSSNQLKSNELDIEPKSKTMPVARTTSFHVLCGCEDFHNNNSDIVDKILPGSIDQIWTLMYSFDNQGFLDHFMKEKRHLKNIKFTLWDSDSEFVELDTIDLSTNAYSSCFADIKVNQMRRLEYIQKLNNPLIRQTQCFTSEKVISKTNEYVCMEMIGSNPDVPGGDCFSTLVRVCLLVYSSNRTRVRISLKMDWTRQTWLRGISF